MAIINTIKGFFGYGEDDFEDYDEEYEEYEEEEEAPKRSFFKERQSAKEEEDTPKRSSKVVPITSRNERANVQIITPTVFDDTRKAAEIIMNRRVLILNVTKMRDTDEAMRVVDFISGTVYGLRGNIRKVHDGIFVAAPSNIDISGDSIKDHTYNNFNLRHDG
ncbi:MAG: cell division protein SepF [Clostridiales bacterium]|nr:cell division protein SepF [Clostridiales bacterium]